MAKKILVVDDEPGIRETIRQFLNEEGFRCEMAATGKKALDLLKAESFDLLLSDIKMPEMDGTKLLEHTREWSSQTLVIIMTAFASVETAVKALRLGAADYLTKPIDFDELLARINGVLERQSPVREHQYLREKEDRTFNFNYIIGESEAMKSMYRIISKVAPTKSSVLITGPSGSGKELVARALHQHSDRRKQAFVAINCGAIPESLFESELFGHKKGAFTGATSDRDGVFLTADKGTLFFDEIGEMPLSMQVKLLRVLQEDEVQAVGASKPKKVDVCSLAATNKNLNKESEQGRFREDLFYRLNIIEISVPPLKERLDDLPQLCVFFIQRFNKEFNKSIKGLSARAMRCLLSYEWKGQVKELENVIERAILLTDNDFIEAEDFPITICPNPSVDAKSISSEDESLNQAIEQFEKNYLAHMLAVKGGSRAETSRALGIDPSTLYRKMEKFGLN